MPAAKITKAEYTIETVHVGGNNQLPHSNFIHRGTCYQLVIHNPFAHAGLFPNRVGTFTWSTPVDFPKAAYDGAVIAVDELTLLKYVSQAVEWLDAN